VKYLKKLTPKQIGQYDEKIKLFKESIFPNHSKINTHSLSWKLKWKYSFSCCTINWRSDRILFEIKEWWSNYYEIILVEFLSVWDHNIYN